ncbi:hypothetical protein, partial [Rhodoblastus sp.]|uniref:hypothetical protein n=1 Tax=Rhodoblastus sp. TaxID=1962975 RepID=UPI003F9B9BA7
IGVQNVGSTVANGLGNAVGGNVITEGHQSVGDHGFLSPFGSGGQNIGVQHVNATVANGVGNFIGGDVVTEGHQSVGDHGLAIHAFH